MKTVVYQSYRTKNVPSWITRCLETVRGWALGRTFDYRFIDDRLLEYVPRWYREKVEGHMLPISDLARLELAKEFLAEGYERTIWMDADMLVFDPEGFAVEVSENFAFCREVWTTSVPGGRIRCFRKVNNSVSVFVRNPPFLTWYIEHCLRIVRETERVGNHAVGTRALTRLHRDMRFHLLENVGMVSPAMIRDLSGGDGSTLRAYMRAVKRPIGAANLCGSMIGPEMTHERYEAVVEELLRTRGDAINQYLP